MRFLQHDDDESVLVSLQPPLLPYQDDSVDSIISPATVNRRVPRRGTIDTTPGSDQVENFRPLHFLSGPESPTHLLPALGYPQLPARRVSVFEEDVHQSDILENDKTNHKSMKKTVDTKRKKSRDLADPLSRKFCGFSFPTKDMGVDDISLCCDGMYIRDKLKCLFDVSTTPTNVDIIHKALSHDEETCPVDNESVVTLAVSEQDVSPRNDHVSNAIPKRFYHMRSSDSYTVNGTNENEESTVTSTGSEETSRTAVSKSPRRLRLARLLKQRMQQQQDRVSSHPLSIP